MRRVFREFSARVAVLVADESGMSTVEYAIGNLVIWPLTGHREARNPVTIVFVRCGMDEEVEAPMARGREWAAARTDRED